jgi:hypothetical protein
MFRLYGQCAAQAVTHALRAWPVVFSFIFYAVVMLTGARFLAPLGIVGRFLLGFLFAACVSSYLHLLARAVEGGKIKFIDFKESFGSRFWDVISVLFAFWIIDFAVGILVGGMGDKGILIRAMIGLTMTVFFNPVPELLYQGSSRSFSLLRDAARFISAHGPEWLFPNLLFAVALLAPTNLLQGSAMGERILRMQSVFSVEGIAQIITSIPLWLAPLVLLFIQWAMVFRGLLFREISSGSARQRAFRNHWRQ